MLLTASANVTDERETLTYGISGTAGRELAERAAADGHEPDLVLSLAEVTSS